MKMNRFFHGFCGLLLIVSVSACAYPETSVTQGGAQTALYFSNSPAGAHVYIDGVDAGVAEVFDGKAAALAVTPGRHIIEIRDGSLVLFRKDMFLGDGVILNVNVN